MAERGMRGKVQVWSSFVAVVAVVSAIAGADRIQAARPNPILFVTQVPIPFDDQNSTSVFANHQANIRFTPRGGDLWILYPDDSLKNLTATAGFGANCAAGQICFQGSTSIAVREPSVHWSGTKALFSMVVGAPPSQHVGVQSFWQIYEITGLGKAQTPVITKVPNQPANYNNVAPFYGTDERVLFTSDRPRGGEPHLYPQLDEYKSQPTVTGLWSLDPATGDLHLVNHTVSGEFSPTIDSFGRIIVTRWDHLQRDSLADKDFAAIQLGNPSISGTFDYSDESAAASRLAPAFNAPLVELFPEPQSSRTDLLAGSNVIGMEFNQFFPWALNEDGTGEEIVNHSGRQDFRFAVGPAFNDNSDLIGWNMISSPPARTNLNYINNLLQIKERPTLAGHYLGIDATETGTHAGGQLIEVVAPPSQRPDLVTLTWWTDSTGKGTNAGTGHYRNPLPLSDGSVVVSYTSTMAAENQTYPTANSNPVSTYTYRLRTMTGNPPAPSQTGGPFATASPTNLTDVATSNAGILRSAWWWDPDLSQTYANVKMWELDPVEVVTRTKPVASIPGLALPEQHQFTAAGVDPTALRNWMAANDLALIVSRNLTTRDHDDKQQPFNLRVKFHDGSTHATTPAPGATKLYDITHLQIFQADSLRGLGGTANPLPGRRPLARPMHDGAANNPPNPNPSAPTGTIAIAADGSTAAFVPARRALSWAVTDDTLTSPRTFTPVIHERYWLTFQPGEIRVCASCHGLSHTDQAGGGVPANDPQALLDLLNYWKAQNPPPASANGFYAITPCRILDTRLPDGAGGGPAIAAQGTRVLNVGNRCKIPANAMAVSINVTVTGQTAAGFLRLYPSDIASPNTSTISFSSTTTRANNSVMALSTDGSGTLKVLNASGSTAHVVLDVNGYFE